jgi:hypothetical protein
LGIPAPTQEEEKSMKRIRFTPLFFRRIHKWVGLILGIQFILWSISGAMMAFIDMEDVSAQPPAIKHPIVTEGLIAPEQIGLDGSIDSFRLHMSEGRPIYQLAGNGVVRLFDATTGDPIVVDEALVRQRASLINGATIRSVSLLDAPNLEAREFDGPMWRVDFNDAENTSAYFAADTGHFLIARSDGWRLWDFFWMLHNMDYVNRTSFNHPLIIAVAFGVLFLSGTGFYLLFKSFTRRDFKWLKRSRLKQSKSSEPISS